VNLRFGLDLVAIASVARDIVDQGSPYLERIYTAGEVAACRRADGIDARRLAERFAVKQATLKVLAVADETIDLRSIELVCAEAGRLGVALHGQAAEIATAEGIGHLSVSVTRDDRLAAAAVAAEVAQADGDIARG
jgi:holo-[acyl-carrier protein] synthase